ncbi:hypothetical protein K8R66_01950 [bacterium]|nr:hypothetical protein [bacterium]
MSNEIIKKKEKIEAIYQEYIVKLNALQKQQAKIINEFLQKLEKQKMTKIRNKLNTK